MWEKRRRFGRYLAALQVDLLRAVRVRVGLGHVHGLGVLAGARQVALALTHDEILHAARLCVAEEVGWGGGEGVVRKSAWRRLWAIFLTETTGGCAASAN